MLGGCVFSPLTEKDSESLLVIPAAGFKEGFLIGLAEGRR